MIQTGENITFPAGSGTARREGYLARPEGTGPFPGVVIIHEIYGMNDNIRDIARRFASEGYVALGVDLFSGRNRTICMFRFFSQMIFNSLNNASIQDLKSALTYLAEQPGVDAERIGAIGFCMGGGFAIAWGAADNRLKAIAPFYGSNPRPLEAVARSCPVVGSYPDKDFTTPQGQKLAVALERYHIPADIKVYPNSKHSFFNDQGHSYNEAAATDAWQRVLAFFKEYVAKETAETA